MRASSMHPALQDSPIAALDSCQCTSALPSCDCEWTCFLLLARRIAGKDHNTRTSFNGTSSNLESPPYLKMALFGDIRKEEVGTMMPSNIIISPLLYSRVFFFSKDTARDSVIQGGTMHVVMSLNE